MTGKGDVVPVAVLRDALKGAITASSLRAVAAEVGLSPSGLRTFVAGGRPHPRTVYLATSWYIRRPQSGVTDASTAKAGINALIDHLSENARAEAARAIREILRDASRDDGKPIPKWVREIE